MIAAAEPVQRPADAKLLVIERRGDLRDSPRANWLDLLRAGDLVIANDAATLPASLRGHHVSSGSEIEVRLAGRPSFRPEDVAQFTAVVFGTGDYRTPTEHRPLPPPLAAGDRLALASLDATITQLLDHPRL